MNTNTTMASSTVHKSYTFQSEPRSVRNRPKYRDEQKRPLIGNLMNDPRVIRGNTFSRDPTATINPVEIQKQQEKKRKRQARARAKERMNKKKDVEPVAGRVHMEVQTELYLEEITDRVEEADMAVQTDPFLDRPPSPQFVPAKTGVDAATQIEEGDLFDFDLESKPILEVLVGKTIEQSLMEVMEEEELDRLRDHQMEFEELRAAELIETQRLEEQARRRRDERERRMQQQAKVAQQEQETTKKIAARSFAQSYLSGLVPTVFDSLDTNGYFYDTQEREVEEQFLPWLLDGVQGRLRQQQRGREMLDDVIKHVVAARSARHAPPPPPVVEGGDEATQVVEPTEGATDDIPAKTPEQQEEEQQQNDQKENPISSVETRDTQVEQQSPPQDEQVKEPSEEDTSEEDTSENTTAPEQQKDPQEEDSSSSVENHENQDESPTTDGNDQG